MKRSGWMNRKIHQALANLLNNALAHSQPEHIRMQARRQDHWLVLTVSDDGCGIDAKHLDRIFERFYRVDKSRSRASGGSGLGLAIVQAIVSAHQGEIEVDSEIGRGSRFVIRLPVRSDAADHPCLRNIPHAFQNLRRRTQTPALQAESQPERSFQSGIPWLFWCLFSAGSGGCK